jgi:hypothetical protein
MFLWKQKVSLIQLLYIQRSLKAAIKRRKILHCKLLQLWEGFEPSMFAEISERRHKKIIKSFTKEESPESSTFNSISSVPTPIKLIYIKEKINSIIKTYILSINEFRANSDSNFSLSKVLQVKPKSPEILKEFTKEIFYQLIQKSHNDRYKWKGHIKN